MKGVRSNYCLANKSVLQSLVDEGHTLGKIAELYRVKQHVVLTMLKKLGVKYSVHTLCPYDLASIISRVESGESVDSIAHSVRARTGKVYFWLKEVGIVKAYYHALPIGYVPKHTLQNLYYQKKCGVKEMFSILKFDYPRIKSPRQLKRLMKNSGITLRTPGHGAKLRMEKGFGKDDWKTTPQCSAVVEALVGLGMTDFVLEKRMSPTKFRSDIFFTSVNLDIEIDGWFHTKQARKFLCKDEQFDTKRDQQLAEHGYRVLRYWNGAVDNDALAVAREIVDIVNWLTLKDSPSAEQSADMNPVKTVKAPTGDAVCYTVPSLSRKALEGVTTRRRGYQVNLTHASNFSHECGTSQVDDEIVCSHR